MPVAGFDIFVNGSRRTFHDVERVAISVACNLKQREPDAVVTIQSTETGEVRTVLPDGRLA
jgi:hypothetical protein